MDWMREQLGPWGAVLSEEVVAAAQQAMEQVDRRLEEGRTVYPPREEIFRALTTTPPEKVKVCIVGQDPYHGPGQANGLAFSVAPGCKLPPSLRNIFKELVSDIGCGAPASGDLGAWAEQGVLLLNSVLTVEAGAPNSHANLGWRTVTSGVYQACAALPQPVVFLTWGAQARKDVQKLLEGAGEDKRHIWSSHPSPLGARQSSPDVPAFLGSRPFSLVNRLLVEMGVEPVDWTLPQRIG